MTLYSSFVLGNEGLCLSNIFFLLCVDDIELGRPELCRLKVGPSMLIIGPELLDLPELEISGVLSSSIGSSSSEFGFDFAVRGRRGAFSDDMKGLL